MPEHHAPAFLSSQHPQPHPLPQSLLQPLQPQDPIIRKMRMRRMIHQQLFPSKQELHIIVSPLKMYLKRVVRGS